MADGLRRRDARAARHLLAAHVAGVVSALVLAGFAWWGYDIVQDAKACDGVLLACYGQYLVAAMFGMPILMVGGVLAAILGPPSVAALLALQATRPGRSRAGRQQAWSPNRRVALACLIWGGVWIAALLTLSPLAGPGALLAAALVAAWQVPHGVTWRQGREGAYPERRSGAAAPNPADPRTWRTRRASGSGP